MTITCTNCGYINTMADTSSAVCPNCGTFYADLGATEATPTMPTPPASLATPTAPPGLYAYPSSTFSASPPSAPRTAHRNRRSILIAAIAGVAIAALLAGGLYAFAAHGSTPVAAVSTATAVPTNTVAPGTTVTLQDYTDPNQQFTIKYPSTWQAQTSSMTLNGTSVHATAFTSNVHSGVLVIVGTNLSLQNIANVVTQSFQGTNYLAATSTTPVTIRKNQWQTTGGTFTSKNNKTAGIEGALLQHGSLSYLVIGFGPPKQFGVGKKGVFVLMLKSLMPTA